MLSRYRWTWAGLAFGLVLFVLAFGAAGGGHGTMLPSAVFGAPLGILVPVLPILFWWPVIGALLDRLKWRAAITLLAIHTACIPIILLFGTPAEPGDEQWRYFERVVRFESTGMWIVFGSYALGLIGAWSLAIQQMNTVPVKSD